MPENSVAPDCERVFPLEALARAANEASVGVFAADVLQAPPRIVYVNQAISRITGLSQAHLLGATVWDLVDAPERERLLGVGSDIRSPDGFGQTFQATLRRHDGHSQPAELVVGRLPLGDRVLSVGFIFDASARLRAETALRASEARFRAVVESAPDGVLILRGERIVFLNPRAAALLGTASREHALGASLFEFLPVSGAEEARARLVPPTGRATPGAFTYVLANPGGRERVIELSSIPIEYEGLPALMAFARDVTERKAIETKLLWADRLAAVGTLAAGITHEINNPLSYVLLNLQRLRRDLDELAAFAPLEPDRSLRMRKSIENAQHGAARIESIVRGLRTFARLEDEARGPVDVAVVLDSAIRLAENEIRHRARLVRRATPVSLVEANPGRLEQVFVNLLVNAAQALSDGDATRDEIRVTLCEEPPGSVTVEVFDTGPGIPADVIDHVFDPFFSTKPVGVGTGLGLTICQNIVSALGGSIEVFSGEGTGTRVRVSLPILDPAAASAAPLAGGGPSLPGAQSMRRRVLVVDDDEDVARSLAMALEDTCDVTLSLSGTDALSALSPGVWPDAILVDVMMPGMSGADLHRAIARRWPGLERRIVFVTGGAFDDRAQAFLAAVDNPRLNKPLDTAQVLAAVERVSTAAAFAS